jgi:hypothetical protein
LRRTIKRSECEKPKEISSDVGFPRNRGSRAEPPEANDGQEIETDKHE